jgi:multiple sugar transport system permease protein
MHGRKPLVLPYVSLTAAAALTIVPVLWMIAISFRGNAEVFAFPPRFIPAEPTLAAYSRILANPVYMRYFFNSYFVCICVTFLSVAIGSFSAYGFSRFAFPGRQALYFFLVFTQMVPAIIIIIPYFGFIVKAGLYDSYAGLVLTYLSFSLPYSTVMMIGYLDTISKELDEAAIVDGCSRVQTLFRIVLPAAAPGLVSTMVYAFILSWNEYVFALTLTRRTAMRTVPIGIAMLIGEQGFDWNSMMAFALLGSVPILVLFVAVQKQFISGLTAGSVKG